MKRVLYYEEKLTPESSPLSMYSICSTYSFLFSKTLPPFPSKLANKTLISMSYKK